jgi:hypothetical protein
MRRVSLQNIRARSGIKEALNSMESIKPTKLFVLVCSACLLSAAIGAVVGIAVFHYMQKTPQNVLTTRRLVVVDNSGKARALLGTNERGEVSMQFVSSSENPSLSIGIFRRTDEQMKHPFDNGEDQQEWVPFLRMLEASGRPAAELTTVGHGNAVLNFNGDQQNSGISLGYVGDGRDDGTFGAAWGLIASYKTFSKSVGVYGYDSEFPYSMVPPPPSEWSALRKKSIRPD